MPPDDRSSKWLIQHHGAAILRIAGIQDIVSWRSLAAEGVQPRKRADGLIETHCADSTGADLFVLALMTDPDEAIRTEPGISTELVRHTARTLDPVARVKILDGNHLAGADHRLQELRSIGARALPGQALVVLAPQVMLATDMFPSEDGHAQERSLLEVVLRAVRPNEAWIADRNVRTTDFLFGITTAGAVRRVGGLESTVVLIICNSHLRGRRRFVHSTAVYPGIACRSRISARISGRFWMLRVRSGGKPL